MTKKCFTCILTVFVYTNWVKLDRFYQLKEIKLQRFLWSAWLYFERNFWELINIFYTEANRGLVSLKLATLLKKRLRHRCFSVNYEKFLIVEHLRPASEVLPKWVFLTFFRLLQRDTLNMNLRSFCSFCVY